MISVSGRRPRFRALAVVIGALMLIGTACSGGGEDGPSDAEDTSVDIGGRSLFAECQGDGSRTVILESGLGAASEWWDDVFDDIAVFARVCRYDRANLGNSDPTELHSAEASVEDLEALLEAKSIAPPFVLVAWSGGGFISRLFAARHPNDVAGMVLIDTVPEDYRDEGDPFVPDDVRQESYWQDENAELLDVEATIELIRAESTPGSFGAKPLVVLTPETPTSGEIGTGGSPGLPTRVPEIEPIYVRLEAAIAELSSAGRLVLVPDTGHCIQCDHPDVVVDAIREVVTAS